MCGGDTYISFVLVGREEEGGGGELYFLKYNFQMNPFFRLLVNWLVCLSLLPKRYTSVLLQENLFMSMFDT